MLLRHQTTKIYLLSLILIIIAICCVTPRLSVANPKGSASEYQIKAAFLYKFAYFIEWPPEYFLPDDAFHLCLLGDDPFGGILDFIIREARIRERLIEIRRYQQIEQQERCHILFISESKQQQLPKILQFLNNQPILTVGEASDFLENGGMIQFFISAKQQVRFAIQAETMRESQLKISAKLMRVAKELR